MTLVLCPACKGQGFLWSVDDANETHWYCSLCGFSAQENEGQEKQCAACGCKSAILLNHDDQIYYWCGLCGFHQPTDNK